jgi:hypothetical protein
VDGGGPRDWTVLFEHTYIHHRTCPRRSIEKREQMRERVFSVSQMWRWRLGEDKHHYTIPHTLHAVLASNANT